MSVSRQFDGKDGHDSGDSRVCDGLGVGFGPLDGQDAVVAGVPKARGGGVETGAVLLHQHAIYCVNWVAICNPDGCGSSKRVLHTDVFERLVEQRQLLNDVLANLVGPYVGASVCVIAFIQLGLQYLI